MKASIKQMNSLGFALVSSNRNRILFFNEDYEITKRIQLHYMRNDLLYLVPVDRFMLQRHILEAKKNQNLLDFAPETCIRFTFNNASILQVEMDVAPFRVSKMQIHQTTEPSQEEYNIHNNLIHSSRVVEQFEHVCIERLSHNEQRFKYVIKGYEMFHKFCEENLGTSDSVDYMFEKDVSDELQYRESIFNVKRSATDVIMGMDFALDPKNFKLQLSQHLDMLKANTNLQSEAIFKQIAL